MRRTQWLIVLAIVLLLGASHVSAEERVVLTAFTSGDINYLESTRLFFDEVERRFPDIKIDMEIGTLEKFTVMYASGIVPDLLRLYNNVHEYAAQGMIQSLEPFLATSDIRREDFIPVIVDRSLSYEGELYSLPFGLSIVAYFVNVERFNEAGLTLPDESWSWEVEGLDAGRKMTRVNPDSGLPELFFLAPIYDMNPVDAFIYSAGGAVFDEEFNFVGTSQPTIEALQFLQDISHVHRIIAGRSTPGGPWNLISTKSSSILTGSSYVSYLIHEDLPFEWKIGLMPTLNGGRASVMWPETPWAIPTGAEHPEEAWRVLEFIGSPEGQALAVKLGLAIPPIRMDTMGTDFLQEYPTVQIENIATMTLQPLTKPSYGTGLPADIRTRWSSAVWDILGGTVPARQRVEAVAPTIEAAVREYMGL